MGRLIPAGTGLMRYKKIAVENVAEPVETKPEERALVVPVEPLDATI
jgi:hypothetical protein